MDETTIAPEDLRASEDTTEAKTVIEYARLRGQREGMAQAYELQHLRRQPTWVVKQIANRAVTVLAERASEQPRPRA